MLTLFNHFPYSENPSEDICTELRGQGTSGETISLSFSLRAEQNIEEVTISCRPISAPNKKQAPASELYLVHKWKQAGLGRYQSAATTVGELLLKTDNEELSDSYYRSFRHWRDYRCRGRFYKAPKLRLTGPVVTSLKQNESKQIWVSVNIPASADAGRHCSEVLLECKQTGQSCRIPLNIEILPIKLHQPEQDLMIFYKGTLDRRRPQHYVTEKEFRLHLQDIYEHGFRSISINESSTRLAQKAINIADKIGFDRTLLIDLPFPEKFEKLKFKRASPIFYVADDGDIPPHRFDEHYRRMFSKAEMHGGEKLVTLIFQKTELEYLRANQGELMPDCISYYLPMNLEYFRAYALMKEMRNPPKHLYWLAHMEKPNVHRLLAGALLWKSRAEGITLYCYQHRPKHPHSPFDDFDEWEPGFTVGTDRRPMKDHMTTYPALNGIIPTTQWEGLREGITDLRYIATADSLIKETADNKDIEIQEARTLLKSDIDNFLQRIDIRKVQIDSESEREPLDDIRAEEYQDFRQSLTNGILSLNKLLIENK